MKKLLPILALLLATLPVFAQISPSPTTEQDPFPANYEMILAWNPNPPIELVEKYNIYIERSTGPGTLEAVKVVSTSIVGIELTQILAPERNGKYRVVVTAVNSNGVESTNSEPVWILWHFTPSPPTGVHIEFRPRVAPAPAIEPDQFIPVQVPTSN